MIRRTSRHGWLLIHQVDHARLAGQLAADWGGGPCDDLLDRDQLLWAIFHHDDGWPPWDELGAVDPIDGKPRAFNEMALADSLAIWSRSIALAAEQGPLAAYVVAGHFCALARRSAALHAAERHSPAARFVHDNESAMHGWLTDWQAERPSTNTLDQARMSLSQLQFFDLLSLIFCCDPPNHPQPLSAPGGHTFRFECHGTSVGLDPWPFNQAGLNLEVPALALILEPFASRRQLAGAATTASTVRWQLHPSVK